MSVLRRTVRLPFLSGYNRIRWDLSKLKDQHIELWIESVRRDPRCLSLSIYWNRLLDPRTWLWCKTNGAVRGVDNCFDFNMNLFVFHFSYTDYGFWRYKNIERRLRNMTLLKIAAGIALYVVSAIALLTFVLKCYVFTGKDQEFPGSMISMACGLYAAPLLIVFFLGSEIIEKVRSIINKTKKSSSK